MSERPHLLSLWRSGSRLPPRPATTKTGLGGQGDLVGSSMNTNKHVSTITTPKQLTSGLRHHRADLLQQETEANWRHGDRLARSDRRYWVVFRTRPHWMPLSTPQAAVRRRRENPDTSTRDPVSEGSSWVKWIASIESKATGKGHTEPKSTQERRRSIARSSLVVGWVVGRAAQGRRAAPIKCRAAIGF